MRALQKLGLYAAVLTVAVLMYFPYRLVAQHTNIVFRWGSDNFYYWPATFLWPSWSFLVTFSAHATGRLLQVRWYWRVFVLLFLLAAWIFVPSLDEALGIEGGGGDGLRSWPSNNPGWNTPMLSVMMCPLALLAGVAAGELVTRWYVTKIRVQDAA